MQDVDDPKWKTGLKSFFLLAVGVGMVSLDVSKSSSFRNGCNMSIDIATTCIFNEHRYKHTYIKYVHVNACCKVG